MFQNYTAETSPEQGPPRLKLLRRAIAAAGVSGFLIPRADAHRGEDVAPGDERLAWLTGFTGSAGFACVLPEIAGVFIDGRYRLQVVAQIAAEFTPVHWPETALPAWLKSQLPEGGKIGFDPWLHTMGELEEYQKALTGSGVELVPLDNLVDHIWADRPAPPNAPIVNHPLEFAGQSSRDKRQELAAVLRDSGQKSVVLSLPDSIAWLLNIRGSDIKRTPVPLLFAVLHDDAKVTVFTDPERFEGLDLGADISTGDMAETLAALNGPVRLDKSSAPVALNVLLRGAGIDVQWGDDPCRLPKARKNSAEIEGMRQAHLRDAAAMVNFLAWLDAEAPNGGLSEISVAQKLEGFRSNTNVLRDISFETISGSGPNGAIVHYRVTDQTDRAISPGELLLVDSGGQYLDGTTDITRTVIVGTPNADQRGCFTRVLQGMISVSRVRFPVGLTGRDLDPLARFALWTAGQDYDHGTGHGVGAYLGVHEGPQAISRRSEVKLETGMILSNEPGYYREGAFGIRIENLIVVQDAPDIPGADARKMLDFETLTYVPIDRRLIDADMLAPLERVWIDSYHAQTYSRLHGRVDGAALRWLKMACAKL